MASFPLAHGKQRIPIVALLMRPSKKRKTQAIGSRLNANLLWCEYRMASTDDTSFRLTQTMLDMPLAALAKQNRQSQFIQTDFAFFSCLADSLRFFQTQDLRQHWL